MCWQNRSLKDLSFNPDLQFHPYRSIGVPLSLLCVIVKVRCECIVLFFRMRVRAYLCISPRPVCVSKDDRMRKVGERGPQSRGWGLFVRLFYFHLFPSFLERWRRDESSHNGDAPLRRSFRRLCHSGHSPFVLGLGDEGQQTKVGGF